jgi:hypothetical protein
MWNQGLWMLCYIKWTKQKTQKLIERLLLEIEMVNFSIRFLQKVNFKES